MRSKRTQKSTPIESGKSAPNGTEVRAETTLLNAENARREAERKYQDIFENAVEGIFQTSPGGGFITANPALARMLGFESPEELIRARAHATGGTYYVHPERRVELKRLLDQHDTVRGFEFEAYRKDGAKIWMSNNVRAVRDVSGRPLYYEGIVEDITERKRVEEALRASEERYRDLIENSHELICTHDLDGLVLSANPAAAAALGYDLDEYVGKKTIRDLLAPEVKDQFDQYMARLREEGATSGIMLVQTRSGERRVWEYYNSLRTEGVATPIVRGVARDITDQKRGEEALRASEKRFRTLIENSSDAIVLLDADGMIIDHAPRTGRVMGYANESLIGRDVLEMIHPEDRALVRRVLNELLTGEAQGITLQFRALHRTGRLRWGEAVAANHLGDPEVRAIVVNYRDITERKQAEAALRESEERLRLALDAAHMGTFDWDVRRNRTTWSRWHEELWGYKPGEFAGTYEAFSERVHHDDLPGINADIARCVAVREPSVREFRVVWPDGSLHWMQSRGEFTFGDDGQPVRMRGVVVETTARRLAEEALRTSEDRLRVGLNTANIAVFNQDLDLRYIWMHQPQLGYTSEQVTGHTDAELLPPEAARQMMEIKRRVLESGLKEHAEVPVSLGGQTFVYDLVVEPLRDASSAIIGLTGASLDITERKRAEAALQESEERFRQLSESAFEAIILHDHGTILEVNQSFCRMYGYERAEVIGKSVLDLALPEFRELLLQKVRSGDTGSYEGPALRKDGTIFRAELAGKPIHYQGRTVRVAAIRDVTEQKRNKRRQAAQHAVTRVLAESATLAEATPQLLQAICENLRWKIGEFWRVCDSTNLLRCVETWHVPGLDAASFIEASRQIALAPGVGLLGRVWQSGQPAWIPDVATDPTFRRAAMAAKVGLHAALAFPIFLGSQTLGIMLFLSRRVREVDEDLLKIMSAIGSQIGQFTERKRAEDALRASERRYRDIFSFAPVGIYQSLRDGTIITANQTLAEMLEYESVDELLTAKLGRDVYLCGGERETLILEHEIRGYPTDLELQWKTRDGSPIWVQLTAHAIKGANGATEYWEGFVRDITERKRTEEALGRKTHELSEFVEHATVGIHWVGPDGIVQFVNRAELEMLGYTREEYIGHHIAEFHADQPVIRDILDRLNCNETIREYAARMRCKDGSIKDVIIDSSVLWEDGKFIHTRCFTRDITERKRANEELRESEEKYRTILENIEDGYYEGDVAGNLTFFNDSLCGILGYSRDEMLGMNNRQYMDDLNAMKVYQTFNEVYRTGKPAKAFDWEMIRKDGTKRFVEASVSRREDSTGQAIGFRGIVRDITERKLQEEALRESETALKQSQRVAVLGHYVFDVGTSSWTSSEVLDEIFGIDDAYPRNVEGWLNILHPEHRDEMRAYLMDHVLQGRNSFDREYRIVRINDKAVRWVHGLGNLELNAEGQPARMFGVIQDIAERKLIEEALRDSEGRYRDLVENSREFICTHDLNGVILSANRAASEVLGYDLKDWCGKKNYRDLLVPEVRDQFDDYLARLRRDGFASGLTLVQTSSGERRILEYHNTVRTEGVGTPIVRGMARDITERRRAEKAMSDLRRELELTMSSMEEGVHRVDLKGNIVFENPAAARMLGWQVSDLLGKSGHLTMHHTRPDRTPYPVAECPIYASFRDGVSRHVTDEVFWRQDGTSFPVEYTTAPVRDDRNELVATVVTFSDITDRKQAEGALRESEERYRTLFENAKDAIYVHDLDGNYTSVNPAAEKLSGYRRDELIGQNFAKLIPKESIERAREALWKKVREKGGTTYETEIVTKDGKHIPVEVSSRLIFSNGVAVGVQGSARDITEPKRIRQALQNYSRKLLEAQEAERRRIALELHDQIGQVLTALKLNTHAIQGAREAREAGALVEDHLKMLDEALEQVRDLSVDLRPPLLDDLGLVTALRWYIDRQTQRTGVPTSFTCDTVDPDLRLSSEIEIACFRIAQEALTNVVRHAQAKLVTVRLSQDGTHLHLVIKDDGVGFDLEARRTQSLTSGTLGLDGMEQRAHAVGGLISIDSADGKGTALSVQLPLEMPKPKTRSQKAGKAGL
jgi:PAS domain S-box-containing protein